jgi:hypothetical protein
MLEKQEKLLESLISLCDDIVSDAYVITDGYQVSAIVIDKKIADFLCRQMRKKFGNDKWVYLSIPQSIEYAFSCGRELGRDEFKESAQPVDGAEKERIDYGEDTELRTGGVQSEQKSD